jgi:hypothetical protein
MSKNGDVIKALCDRYQCSKSGKKQDMIDRLIESGITRANATEFIDNLARLKFGTQNTPKANTNCLKAGCTKPAYPNHDYCCKSHAVATITKTPSDNSHIVIHKKVTDACQRISSVGNLVHEFECSHPPANYMGYYFKKYPEVKSVFYNLLPSATNLNQTDSKCLGDFINNLS